MANEYDLVIIGAGTAAMTAATRVRRRQERGRHGLPPVRRHLRWRAG
jgi:choline dehydrogenase-like flavoprotein